MGAILATGVCETPGGLTSKGQVSMLHTTSTNNDFFRSLQALVEHGQTEAEKFCQAIQPLRLELERIGGAV